MVASGRRLVLAAGILIACSGPVLAAAGKSGTRRRAAPPPQITVSSNLPGYLDAQSRLAQFIRHLQAGHRARAVRLFCRHVTARERDGFLRKTWLRTSDRRDHRQILFLPDIQIRVKEAMQGDTLRLEVLPRVFHQKPKKNSPVGVCEVRMHRENGTWFIDMRP